VSQHQRANNVCGGRGAGTVGIIAAVACVAQPELPKPVIAPALDGRVVLRSGKRSDNKLNASMDLLVCMGVPFRSQG